MKLTQNMKGFHCNLLLGQSPRDPSLSYWVRKFSGVPISEWLLLSSPRHTPSVLQESSESATCSTSSLSHCLLLCSAISHVLTSVFLNEKKSKMLQQLFGEKWKSFKKFTDVQKMYTLPIIRRSTTHVKS